MGAGKKPIQAYLDIDDIIRIAKEANVDAIHPGYGFLSENPDFADACAKAGIAFIGPKGEVMRLLGNKVAAREVAIKAGVPVVPATGALPEDIAGAKKMAAEVGYPLMLKASWGGGGRGMRVIETEDDLAPMMEMAKREALAAFGNDEVYLEKLIRRARHVEVQILGDKHGNLVHLFERDCSVQRRNQKVVERAPAPYMDATTRQELCASALRLGNAANYSHAGTGARPGQAGGLDDGLQPVGRGARMPGQCGGQRQHGQALGDSLVAHVLVAADVQIGLRVLGGFGLE